MKSKRSIKCKRILTILTLVHLACLFVPILIFIPQALTTSEVNNSSKVVISMSGILALILIIISLMSSAIHKLSLHKSIIWIILLAMVLTLPEVKTIIIVMASLSLADELVLLPLRNKYSTMYEVNKEIDKRGINE